MNCKDRDAALKLIAQFEDRADGRHNSTAFSFRETETKPVKAEHPDLPPTLGHERSWPVPVAMQIYQGYPLTVKPRPEDCLLGDSIVAPSDDFMPPLIYLCWESASAFIEPVFVDSVFRIRNSAVRVWEFRLVRIAQSAYYTRIS